MNLYKITQKVQKRLENNVKYQILIHYGKVAAMNEYKPEGSLIKTEKNYHLLSQMIISNNNILFFRTLLQIFFRLNF